ncbi:MAG: PVC-type heme-binding CxxCH protein [Planctomycetota bacterium]|nr:PVC-type heme-binding CxxCH protein [Planctomycetota bacterium]
MISVRAIPGRLLVVFLLFPGFLLGLSQWVFSQTVIEIQKDDVLLFSGGTNMVRLQQAGYLETLLSKNFKAAKPRFRDFSWEADTVYRQGSVVERWRQDGFGNRTEQIKRLQPTIVVSQFGKLESMEGAEKLWSFTEAYLRLIEDYQNQARQIILVSPLPFEKPTSNHVPNLLRHNRVLGQYVAATQKIAQDRGLVFIDLFNRDHPRLTENGMHVTRQKQPYLAQLLAKEFGLPSGWQPDDETLRQSVVEKHRIWSDYWRPANWKLLYGDDSRREFTKANDGSVPFREEWKKLIPLIQKAEARVWAVAHGEKDPGHSRPPAEILHGDPTADVAKEQTAFQVAQGFQVNLFASEKEGLTSPLAIRWDPAGRMYVTVTTTYPHVFPGDLPNDKIYILEDTDRDGVADRSTLFADGLNIPTAIELGNGGVFIGQNSEILFLKDTNGDNQADIRKVVLSGFGNGDSHQTINSFVWSPGGELYMGQGDGIESRVETPWGSADLYQSGFYRLRPKRLQMHPLLDDFMGPGNPWGVEFDDWGQIFSIDGAGGVTHLSLGQIPSQRRLRLGRIGEPGGYCGIAQLSGSSIPKSFQRFFAVGDFKANRVKCFSVTPKGAGFQLDWKEPLLHSKHRNFRPVDVRMGPDGAIYVVDWYNPITCHQDDRYRDPRRDKAHGRIWRVSAPHKQVTYPNLSRATLPEVIRTLASPERFIRYQAKRELTNRDENRVAFELRRWIQALDPKDPHYERHLYEALGTFATLEVPEPSLLARLLEAQQPGARAFASRIAGRWHDRVENVIELLARRAADSNAQVRMEAVAAAAQIPDAQAIQVITRALDFPVDSAMNYVLSQAIHQLKNRWEPAFRRGDLQFDNPNHLIKLLDRSEGKNLLGELRKIASSDRFTPSEKSGALIALVKLGQTQDLETYALSLTPYQHQQTYDLQTHARVLKALVNSVENQQLPLVPNARHALSRLLQSETASIQEMALRLVGLWQIHELNPFVKDRLQDEKRDTPTRRAAMWTFAKLNPQSHDLSGYASPKHPLPIRVAAVEAIAVQNIQLACSLLPPLFSQQDPGKLLSADQATRLLTSILERQNGAVQLTKTLHEQPVDSKVAGALMRGLFSTGRTDPALVEALKMRIGVTAKRVPYSSSYVSTLSAKANIKGAAHRGALLFKSLSCNSCHQVSGQGGKMGPDLTSIGTTLSPERIIEELLWPNRQIKEGYSVLQVATTDGRIQSGYERRTRESEKKGDLILEDLKTGKLLTIRKADVEQKKKAGSPMPTGLTAVLSEAQLLDLIKFLTERGKLR